MLTELFIQDKTEMERQLLELRTAADVSHGQRNSLERQVWIIGFIDHYLIKDYLAMTLTHEFICWIWFS